MKLMAFRPYKHDRSDIAGILNEEKIKGTPIRFEDIDKAIKNLYGN
jgi:hypothetical protein